jgi:hypothetical protein
VCGCRKSSHIGWYKKTGQLTADTDWEKHAPFPSPKGTSRNNNLGVPFTVIADLALYGNVSDSGKRFILKVLPDRAVSADIGSHEGVSTQTYWSGEFPDFLHDVHWRDKLFPFEGTLSPRGDTVSYWDDIHKEWVAIVQNVWPMWLPSRQIGRFATKDFTNWTSRNVLYPDAEDAHDLEHYEEPMMLVPFSADGVILGLLSWFHGDRTHPYGGPALQPNTQQANIWPWCRKGTNELRVTISRDGGLTWDRTVSRKAWIPHGTEQDSENRCVMWCVPPVRVGDEDWFYIYAGNQDHLNTLNNTEQTSYHHSGPSVRHIMLYRQKHNRYVSMHARNSPETLISNPVKVDGHHLQLNVDANRGAVRVGLAPAGPVPTFDGRVPSLAPHLLDKHFLPGFSFDDSEPVHANNIEHTVKFKSGASLDRLKGQEVCLLFQMSDADLYGFRFA